MYCCVGWRETLRRFHARAGRSGSVGLSALLSRDKLARYEGLNVSIAG